MVLGPTPYAYSAERMIFHVVFRCKNMFSRSLKSWANDGAHTRARVFFWYPVEELLHWFQCGKSVHHYLTFFSPFWEDFRARKTVQITIQRIGLT